MTTLLAVLICAAAQEERIDDTDYASAVSAHVKAVEAIEKGWKKDPAGSLPKIDAALKAIEAELAPKWPRLVEAVIAVRATRGIDKGETPIEAACRELSEEVGTTKALLLRESRDWLAYDVPKAASPKFWKGKWRGQRQKWFALSFTGTDADIDIAHHGHEFDAWKWVTARQLLELIVEFKRPVYQAVVKEFSDLL